MDDGRDAVAAKLALAARETDALAGALDTALGSTRHVLEPLPATGLAADLAALTSLAEAARGTVAELAEACALVVAPAATASADQILPETLTDLGTLAETSAARIEVLAARLEGLPSRLAEAQERIGEVAAVASARQAVGRLRTAVAAARPAAGADPAELEAARAASAAAVAVLGTLRDDLAAAVRPEALDRLRTAVGDLLPLLPPLVERARTVKERVAVAALGVEDLARAEAADRTARQATLTGGLQAVQPEIRALAEATDALAARIRPLAAVLTDATVQAPALDRLLPRARTVDAALAEAGQALPRAAPTEPRPPPAAEEGWRTWLARSFRRDRGRTPSTTNDIHQAIERAVLLIHYAAEHGIELKGVPLIDILAFREARTGAGGATAYQEERFWRAYRALAKAVQPANPDSIHERAAFERRSQPHLLGRATRRFRWAMLSSLLIALLVSWYYSALDAPIRRATAARDAFAQAQEALITAREQLITVARQQEPAATFERLATLADAQLNPQTRATAQHAMCRAIVDWQTSIRYLEENRPSGVPQLAAGFVASTSDAAAAILRAVLTLPLKAVGLMETRPAEPPAAPATPPAPFTTLDEEDARLQREVCGGGIATSDRLVRLALDGPDAHVLLEAAKGWRDRIATYLLPLLYGLLGSLAHIVRTLTIEIRDVTFALGSYTTFTVRWLLGALAGVTIGLAVQPETLSSLAGITQLGIAFLAGYSVDILFNFLDRFQLVPRQPDGGKGGPAPGA